MQPGEGFRPETCDWTGGQIRNDDDAWDMRTGASPVRSDRREAGEPGDPLVVDIMDIGAMEDMNRGVDGFSLQRPAP